MADKPEVTDASRGRAGPRGEGQVIPRGDETFLIRVYLGEDPQTGRRRYANETFRGTEAKARRRLREKLGERDGGRVAAPTRVTLGEHLDDWLRRSGRRVRRQTLDDYREKLDRYVRPYLGRRKLSAVTFEDVEGLYGELLEARGLSARTVRYAHSLLRAAFDDAVRRRLVRHSPVVYAELPRQERNEVGVFTEAEARRFLEAARPDDLGAALTLALTTGMRPEEYLGLLDRYLHLDRGVVEVQRVLVRFKGGGWELQEPKTDRGRRAVKIPPQTARALAEHRRRQAERRLRAGPRYQHHGLVFAAEEGTPLSIRNFTARHFKPALVRAKIPPDRRLYVLRHSYATLSLAAGVHPKVVSEALGHASVAFTMDTYAHVLPSMQEAAAEKIARLLFG